MAPPRSPRARASAPRPQRERDYLDALAVMYADYDKVDHRTRIQAYVKAMEQLAQRYPNDDEAQIHYALALNTSASAGRQDLRQSAQRRGDPRTDLNTPAAASRRRALPDPSLRLPADCREGASMQPGATPKSLPTPRMPSTCRRISSRASAIGQSRSHQTSSAAARRERSRDFHDQLHAMDYQVYAYLQLGQDAKAKAAH